MGGHLVGTVVSLLQPDGLAGLAGTRMAGRFCAWRGASDRRYVTTVYPVDRSRADLGLPEFESFILLAVARGAGGRRVRDISLVGRSHCRRAAFARGLACGADEWHVHLIAEDAPARTAAIADLRARHCRPVEALCA